MPLRTSDVFRNNIVTIPELLSDGYGPNSVYLSAVISTTSVTQVITVNLPPEEVSLLYEGDFQVNPGDILFLEQTLPGGIADGYYTVDQVTGVNTVTVLEPLPNSTDGYITFRYTAGALDVGFNNKDSIHITHTNVQQALEDLDASITGGGLTPLEHEKLRQLIHLADGVGGPFEGFLTGAYRSITSSPTNLTPTYICWWTSVAQVAKIVDKTVTYNSMLQPSTIQWRVYNTDGISILASVTDAINYNVIFETSRTRTIIDYTGGCDTCEITVEQHKTLRQLIHLADGVGGPFEGFATGAYREIIGLPFVQSETWYTDFTKAQKIVDHTIVRNSINMPVTITWKVYDVDGVTILSTVSDSINYINNIFEVSRTRAIM